MNEPDYGFEPKIGDPNYEQPAASEIEGRMSQERPGVDYDYDGFWKQLDARVNPRRFNSGLEPLTREDTDAICRMLTNFEIDWKNPPAQGSEEYEESERQAKVLYEKSMDMMLIDYAEFEIKAVSMDAPDFKDVFRTSKVDKRGDPIPKWKRNLPPKVRQKLKRKGGRR